VRIAGATDGDSFHRPTNAAGLVDGSMMKPNARGGTYLNCCPGIPPLMTQFGEENACKDFPDMSFERPRASYA
jgi:hypothetical protein